jgi:hypothetical protein
MAQTKAEMNAKWRAKHPEHKERQREYDKVHRLIPDVRAKARAREIINGALRRAKMRAEVFAAYGGPKCVCCGETLFEGLTIDHTNGDGSKHRKEIGTKGGHSLYRWLKAHGYPPGFQVLCYTCNCAKGTKDHCPHQDRKGEMQ